MAVGPSVSLFLGKIVIDETSRIVAQGGGLRIRWRCFFIGTDLLSVGRSHCPGNQPGGGLDGFPQHDFFAALRELASQGYCLGHCAAKSGSASMTSPCLKRPELLNLLELYGKGSAQNAAAGYDCGGDSCMGIFTFIPAVLVSYSICVVGGRWCCWRRRFPSVYCRDSPQQKELAGGRNPGGHYPQNGYFCQNRHPPRPTLRKCRLFSPAVRCLLDPLRGLFQQMFEPCRRCATNGRLPWCCGR